MRKFVPFLAVAFVLVGALFAGLLVGGADTMSAAPAAAPTPVTANSAANSTFANFLVSQPITADGGSFVVAIERWEFADVQYVIDQGTDVNTTTLKLQFSNDGVNWTDAAAALVTANAADAANLDQRQLFGRFARVFVDVTNANTVTVTANMVGKG